VGLHHAETASAGIERGPVPGRRDWPAGGGCEPSFLGQQDLGDGGGGIVTEGRTRVQVRDVGDVAGVLGAVEDRWTCSG